eukprot:RCo039510
MCILGVNFRRLFPQNPSLLFVSVSGRLPCLLSELQAFFYSNTTPVVAVPFCFFFLFMRWVNHSSSVPYACGTSGRFTPRFCARSPHSLWVSRQTLRLPRDEAEEKGDEAA